MPSKRDEVIKRLTPGAWAIMDGQSDGWGLSKNSRGGVDMKAVGHRPVEIVSRHEVHDDSYKPFIAGRMTYARYGRKYQPLVIDDVSGKKKW